MAWRREEVRPKRHRRAEGAHAARLRRQRDAAVERQVGLRAQGRHVPADRRRAASGSTLLEADRRAAYDDLLPRLVRGPSRASPASCRPSAPSATGRTAFVVPLLRWSELPAASDRSRRTAPRSATTSPARWRHPTSAGPPTRAEITPSVNVYLDRILARAQAREKDPFPTVRTFTQTCEEALVRLAFSKAGCTIDYVSMEIARRWSRWLGLASFTLPRAGPIRAALLEHRADSSWTTAR